MKMAVTRMVLGLILAATLAMYYLETNHDISLEHRRFHGDLAALQRIEATLNQDILKVRFGFLEDYNGFEKPLQTMNKVVEELRQVPLFVPEADRAFLGRSVTELAGSIQEKAALLERFKGLESILDDSMREFPVEANALLERIAAKEGGREVELLLNELIRQVLLYSLDSNARQEPELRRILSRLDAWRGKLEEDAALGTLIAHVHSILQIQPAVETVTRQLVSLPIAARTDEMLRLYEERFAASLRKSHFYRMVLKLLCMALIAGIGYAIYALKRINNDLERRVLKRTTDLLKKNKELQTEAAERIQAQGDLAYERDLLRTLLEHSPDQIYFKDRDSRFIKCSQTLVERFHLNSAEELVGKSDFDFFTEEHARPAFEDEQAIIRTGEPVVGRVEKEVWKDSDKITWALTTKGPLRDKTGGIIGTFGTTKDITTMKEAEEALARVNKELVEISRHAGMAEVATSVLHNVGNVLNSVNISCAVISAKVRNSRVGSVTKSAELLQEHAGDLGEFLTKDPAGQKLPAFLSKLARRLMEEQSDILEELTLLVSNIEHIKEIVAMQQSYAVVGGVRELLPMASLMEDALRMNASALVRHQVEIIREYGDVPPISVEKHKVLQILINLIANAKRALSDSDRTDRKITLRVVAGGGRIFTSVSDNGVGISAENITRIFAHGFTTRKDGHGFGLHSGVLAAQQMGGSLVVRSEGPGTGATFTLELPLLSYEAPLSQSSLSCPS